MLPRSFLNLLARARQGRLKTQPTSTAAPEIFCVGDALPSQQARLLFAGFFARGFCPGEAQDDENLDKKCKKKFSCEISLLNFLVIILYNSKDGLLGGASERNTNALVHALSAWARV